MSVLKDPGIFHDDGERDRRRNHDRIRAQIARQVRERIGDEELITAGPERRIRVPVKGQREWRFVFDRGRQEAEADTIFFDDRARKGPLLDKKATLRANLRRNAAAGRVGIGDFDRADARYLTWREQTRPVSQAVVFLVMDVSGSMGQFHKRIARLFFWWATRFLRRRYTTTEIVFIAHHTEATECDEQQFFTRVESGGTRCSSAYELLLDIQRQRYPVADWNIFVAHCSDGDNWGDDNERLVALLGETAAVANLVGYCQIDRSTRYHWSADHLLAVLSQADVPGVVCCSVSSDTGIWGALKTIFAPDESDVREGELAS
ncbi:MAG: DUF444 family protein [Acidimicrobiia bacterium]|nr:DUF444 family protein [Acidimicrobiia bacterium]